MGIIKSILNFIGGKDPDIFDENGRVRHNFQDEHWKKWDDRFKANPTYDWRNHGAQERARKPSPPPTPPQVQPTPVAAASPAPAPTPSAPKETPTPKP